MWWTLVPPLKISATTNKQNILWDVITYAFESRSSEKMWVRAFLYAAIWSLEDGPGNTSLLVQSHQHSGRICWKADDLTRPLSVVARYAHSTKRRSCLTSTKVCSEKSENYANEKVSLTRRTKKNFFTHSHVFTGKSRKAAADMLSECFREVEAKRLRCGRKKYFQFS